MLASWFGRAVLTDEVVLSNGALHKVRGAGSDGVPFVGGASGIGGSVCILDVVWLKVPVGAEASAHGAWECSSRRGVNVLLWEWKCLEAAARNGASEFVFAVHIMNHGFVGPQTVQEWRYPCEHALLT